MRKHPFSQVDVFGDVACLGNPLAVVHAADDLSASQMQRFAQWANLSETVFLCQATHADADYRVRIFTPTSELPFAGHPTLGAAHAWLTAGGSPRAKSHVLQECEVGLVQVRLGDHLAFAAPPQRRSGPVSADLYRKVIAALGVSPRTVQSVHWVDNGPGWIGVLIDDLAELADLAPHRSKFHDLCIGVVALGGPNVAASVRVFYAEGGSFIEDPVTGSFQAAAAQWLIGNNVLPPHYVAAQGDYIGRRGRVFVHSDDDGIWVGGRTVTVVEGFVVPPVID